MIIAAIAYTITQIYIAAKADESVVHEWINFPDLERFHYQEKTPKEDKYSTLHVGIHLCIFIETKQLEI